MKRFTCMLAALMLAITAMVSPLTAVTAQAGATNYRDYDLQYMSDGGLFDPIYYARNNQDVVTVLQSTDKNVLYQHYLNYGKAEGRMPYDPTIQSELTLTPYSQIAGVVPNSALYFLDSYYAGGEFVWFMVDSDNQLIAYDKLGQKLCTFAFDHIFVCGSSPVYYTADKSIRLLINTSYCIITVMDGSTPSVMFINYSKIRRNSRR